MTTRLPFVFVIFFSTILALFSGAAYAQDAGDSQAPVVSLILNANKALSHVQAVAISEAIHEAASEFSLDPLLLVALAEVESKFNATAKNGASRGMFQIIPRYHREDVAIGYKRWHTRDIFDVRLNTWLGAKILFDYQNGLRSHSMRTALSRYNGTTEPVYANKVLTLYRQYKRSRS